MLEKPVFWIGATIVVIFCVYLLFYTMAEYTPIFYNQDAYTNYMKNKKYFGTHDKVRYKDGKIEVEWVKENLKIVDEKKK